MDHAPGLPANDRQDVKHPALAAAHAAHSVALHSAAHPLWPRTAVSITAMSIFFIVIMASNARLAARTSVLVYALINAMGVICQETPHLSLHHPHALSRPPLADDRVPVPIGFGLVFRGHLERERFILQGS